MVVNAYPAEIRLFARGLYIQNNNYNETARAVKREYPEARCNAETIRRWAEKEDWDTLRGKVSTAARERQEEDISTILEKHKEAYDLMLNRGVAGLRQHSPRSASEASSMVDTGVKGQRLSLRDLISLDFVKRVFQIVSEEVQDEATRRRIALRLRELGGELGHE